MINTKTLSYGMAFFDGALLRRIVEGRCRQPTNDLHHRLIPTKILGIMATPTPPHRKRYELLIERRRVLLELERLHDRIQQHDTWQAALQTQPELSQRLPEVLETLGCQLCRKACQATADALLCDVRRITSRVIVLAKVWVALEKGHTHALDEVLERVHE